MDIYIMFKPIYVQCPRMFYTVDIVVHNVDAPKNKIM